MTITPIKTRIFRKHENLEAFILEYVPALQESSILVVTSKIVALSEGRTHEYDSEETRERLIKEESVWALETKHAWLTIKDGTVMAAAGIDASNADGKLVLLPRDSYASANLLRSMLRSKLRSTCVLRNFGVLITDSRVFPLRAGITGVALGYAGFKGIRDYIGTPDIFGRVMTMSRTDVADSLATAVVLCMGEGAEQQPLCIITDPPVEWTDAAPDPKELVIPPEDDLYSPFFENIPL